MLRRDGTDTSVDTMGRGAVFGEMALLTGERRNATVRAVDSALAVRDRQAAVRAAAAATPGVARRPGGDDGRPPPPTRHPPRGARPLARLDPRADSPAVPRAHQVNLADPPGGHLSNNWKTASVTAPQRATRRARQSTTLAAFDEPIESPDQRTAAGEPSRSTHPAECARAVRVVGRPAGPGGGAGGVEPHPPAGPGATAVRTDGGVAVRIPARGRRW